MMMSKMALPMLLLLAGFAWLWQLPIHAQSLRQASNHLYLPLLVTTPLPTELYEVKSHEHGHMTSASDYYSAALNAQERFGIAHMTDLDPRFSVAYYCSGFCNAQEPDAPGGYQIVRGYMKFRGEQIPDTMIQRAWLEIDVGHTGTTQPLFAVYEGAPIGPSREDWDARPLLGQVQSGDPGWDRTTVKIPLPGLVGRSMPETLLLIIKGSEVQQQMTLEANIWAPSSALHLDVVRP